MAFFLWSAVTGPVFALWFMGVVDSGGPVCYACAVTRSRGAVLNGWLTEEEAERRVQEARQQFFPWVAQQVAVPLAASLVIVPTVALPSGGGRPLVGGG